MSLIKTRLPWEKQWMSVHVGQVLQDMTVGCVEHWRWEALKGRMTHGPAIGEWQSRDDKSIYMYVMMEYAALHIGCSRHTVRGGVNCHL